MVLRYQAPCLSVLGKLCSKLVFQFVDNHFYSELHRCRSSISHVPCHSFIIIYSRYKYRVNLMKTSNATNKANEYCKAIILSYCFRDKHFSRPNKWLTEGKRKIIFKLLVFVWGLISQFDRWLRWISNWHSLQKIFQDFVSFIEFKFEIACSQSWLFIYLFFRIQTHPIKGQISSYFKCNTTATKGMLSWLIHYFILFFIWISVSQCIYEHINWMKSIYSLFPIWFRVYLTCYFGFNGIYLGLNWYLLFFFSSKTFSNVSECWDFDITNYEHWLLS